MCVNSEQVSIYLEFMLTLYTVSHTGTLGTIYPGNSEQANSILARITPFIPVTVGTPQFDIVSVVFSGTNIELYIWPPTEFKFYCIFTSA